MKTGSSSRIAVRAGLLVSLLVFLLEASWIFWTTGGFLRHHLNLPVTLIRYMVYGAVAGSILFVVTKPILDRISIRAAGGLLMGSLLGAAIAVEAGFYALDILTPFDSSPRAEIVHTSIVVLGMTFVAALSASIAAWGGWKLLARLLVELSSTRFGFVVAGLGILTWVIANAIALSQLPEEPALTGAVSPNILLVVLDTVRADALSISGNDATDTPFFDRLAKEGVRFSRATSASTWTPPGHASLFTGLFPISHGTRGRNPYLDESLDLLSTIFRRVGYATLTLYNNPLAGRLNKMDRGFQTAIGVETEHKVSFIDERLYYKFVLKDTGVRKTAGLFEAWVEEYSRRQVPWLAFVNLNDAHAPYQPREPWMSDLLERLKVPVDDLDLEKANFAMTDDGMWAYRRGELDLSDAELKWIRAAYYSEVRLMDRVLGDMFQTMKQGGFLENTLVVVTSDHGEALGEEGDLGHGNGLLASVVRVPLIFWSPGRLEPRHDDRWVSLVDVLPSLMVFAGLDPTEGARRDDPFDGRDLLDTTKEDETLVEHTALNRESCDSFLLLRGSDGIYLHCDDPARSIEIPPTDLNRWTTTTPDATAHSSWLETFLAWKETQASGVKPGTGENDSDLLEKLRALGYIR